MSAKKINRRKFLISSLESAAGLGVLASCDKRTVIEPDVRLPSAPTGLSYDLATTDSGTVTAVTLTWDHTVTDVTGAKLWTGIRGYSIYRNDTLVAQISPPSDSTPSFRDTTDLVVGNTFTYTVKAIDSSSVKGPNGEPGNVSPASTPLLVAIQKPSYVYSATSPSVNTGSMSSPAINSGIVRKMIDSAVTQMQIDNGAIGAGATAVSAWESLFANLSTSTHIGIKINTLGGGGNVNTRPEVVTAIVGSLTSMLGNTFPAYNVIVFDDRDQAHMIPAGYPLRDNQKDGLYRIASTMFNTTLHGVPVNLAEPQICSVRRHG